MDHIYQRFIFLSKKLFFSLAAITLGLFVGLPQLLFFLAPKPRPLPYVFQPQATLLTKKEQEAGKKAVIAFLGDRHGVHFDQYIPFLKKKLSPSLKEAEIINLSAKGHGIHRSLKKLKELQKTPSLVVFLGGHDEFHEKKFSLEHYQKIKKNLSLSKNSQSKFSLDTLSSFGSSLSYPPYKYGKDIVPDRPYHNPLSQQRNLELRLKIYEHEVQQLIQWTLRQKSQLILTTAPVNLMLPPRQICSNASTPSIQQKISFLEKALTQGKTQKIIQELAPLEKVIVGHAGYHFLLGQAFYQESLFSKALKHLRRANSFDCYPTKGSHLLNNILRFKARVNVVTLVDFHSFLPPLKEKRTAFSLKSSFPKEPFYQSFADSLAKAIGQLLLTAIPE